MTPGEITRYLHQHIPITSHLGAAVEAFDGRSIRVTAPLAQNLNHRSTAFGGSLSSLAILSGWALVHLALRGRGVDARVVIQRSAMDFDAPVTGDLVVTSTLPRESDWERFLATFARRGLARVNVRGEVGAGGANGSHDAAYVAMRPERPPLRRVAHR